MNKMMIDYSKTIGKIKPMHAVNNGPVCARSDQTRGNDALYKEAGIPYARTHDASFFSGYGGEHTVDIHTVFPQFDADPNEPDSYDFVLTDQYLKSILAAGTKVFYRLGSKIEHEIKKYGTLPPKDFKKWAVICEHIIRHYNEGWANGFQYHIEYWEIWNEPDLDKDDSPNKRCWGGTAKQYYELYSITAAHLKECFPELKIGGPAWAGQREEWLDHFLQTLTADGNRVPLDFFSWHWYGTEVKGPLRMAQMIRNKLDQNGYADTESILNEWNYVAGWSEEWIPSIKTIIGMKGAAFTAACMCAAQNDAAVDMLMYYDARPCIMNGLFDIYTLYPLKGYYPFKMFSQLFQLGQQVYCENKEPDVFTASAKNTAGSVATFLSYYTDCDDAKNKEIVLHMHTIKPNTVELFLLDDEHDCTRVDTVLENGDELKLTLRPNTVLLLRGKV